MAECSGSRQWRFPLPRDRRRLSTGNRRLGLLLLSVLLVAMQCSGALAASRSLSPPPRSPPRRRAPPPTLVSSPGLQVTLQGMLVYRTTKPSGKWILSVMFTEINYNLPRQPVDFVEGQPIAPGRWISLTCFLPSVDATACTSIADVVVIQGFAPVPTTNVALSLLVMVVSLSASTECASRAGGNATEVRSLFLAPGGYADYFGNCSYGSMVIDRQSLTVVPIVVPCSKRIMNCSEDALAEAAMANVPAGIQTAAFSHFVYVVPKDFGPICNWAGFAQLPGTRTWFTPDNQGIYEKGTVMQELLHNFGLWHGYRNGVEYEDYSTAMGMGSGCPSAPELWRLGWADARAQLNSSTFPPGTFQTYTLPATYRGPTGVMLKIQPDWLGAAYTKNMYLALRVKAAGDIALLPEFNGKLNIHELDKVIDNDFAAAGDPFVSLLGVLNPVSSVTYFNYRLYIITAGTQRPPSPAGA
ncbi:hypothetical protein PLESTF_000316900 [Pleodorina starrii]|nr:hypothetical protein PLESTF_000316900 [Pleodorina starrii]